VPDSSASWLLWQIADSAFPAGGFAHSAGLEAAWRQGEVPRAGGLASFLEAALRQAAAGGLPFVVCGWRSPEDLPALDQHCDAWTTNHVANRASRLQGRAFWSTATRTFRAGPAVPPDPGHLAPVFGALLRELRVPLETTARLFLFLGLRGWISSAVRLGLCGPLEGQTLQHRCAPLAEELVRQAADLTLDDLAQTAPLLDLWQGAQDRLPIRLFQS